MVKKTTLLKDLLTLFKILEITYSIVHVCTSSSEFEFYSYLLSPHYIEDDRLITGFTTRWPTNLQVFEKTIYSMKHTVYIHTLALVYIYIFLFLSNL